MERGGDVLDGLHDGQVLLPEAQWDGTFLRARESLKSLDKLAVLELQTPGLRA